MFNLRKEKEPSDLDREIDRILIEMNVECTDSDEYQNLLSCLERLTAVRKSSRRKPISAEVWLPALIAGVFSTLQVGAVIGYEQKNVITTKALGLFTKIK